MNMADMTPAELTAAVGTLQTRVATLETAGVTPLAWYKDGNKVMVTLTAIVGLFLGTFTAVMSTLNNKQITTVNDKADTVTGKVDAAKTAAEDVKTTTLAHAEKVETDLTKIKSAVKTNGDSTPPAPSPAPAPVLDDTAYDLKRRWDWFQADADRKPTPENKAKAEAAKKAYNEYVAKPHSP
jgi:hypothetical protein